MNRGIPAKQPDLAHLAWIREASEKLKTKDGKEVTVYELVIDDSNIAALSAWAKHFREHYCLDSRIDPLRSGTGKSRSEFLSELIFPDAKSNDFGPATRAGDFAEILISDILEGLIGYWVPRTRYGDKKVRNESPKGTDIIGIRLEGEGYSKPSPNDTLIAFESKAQLSGNQPKQRLHDAVKDSSKDKFRLGESLNAVKRRLIDLNQEEEALRIERFQDALGNPYIRASGAAAIFCGSVYNAAHIAASTDCSNHENRDNLLLVVVHAKQLMSFVHALYERAINEA